MRYGVALALALILFGVTARPFAFADEATTTSDAPSVQDIATTTDATTTDALDSASTTDPTNTNTNAPTVLPDGTQIIKLPISYDAQSNTYYFSDVTAYCDDSINLRTGRPNETTVHWYMGTYPNQTEEPSGANIHDCASEMSGYGKTGVLPLLDDYRHPLSTTDGDRSILINTGTKTYLLKYSVTGGVITAPGSPSFDYRAPFRPFADSVGEHRVIPAHVENGIFGLTPEGCDFLLASVGGIADPANQFDVWARDRAIWGAVTTPEAGNSFGPDHWPLYAHLGLLYHMRKDFDSGSGNPACSGTNLSDSVYADRLNLEHAFFSNPSDGLYRFFFWASTRFLPEGGSTEIDNSNAHPIGYVEVRRENGVWSIPEGEGTSTPPLTCTDHCPATLSSVLFLPGIEGSRLYSGNGTKLWEPITGIGDLLSGNAHVRGLFLDGNGNSVDSGVYVKEGDIMDTVGGQDFYGSFEQTMQNWKVAGIITDWKSISYDWRLSFDDLLNKGADADGKISYLTATDTPYIIQTLRDLAAKAPSGKVTIIAHSNGGLLAKALMRKLGNEASSLIDRIILVAVPQSGAPEALGSILFGQDMVTTIPFTPLSFSYASKGVTRAFAENAPVSYNLLPSSAYFSSVQDPNHSVVEFTDQSSYQKERDAYGFLVNNWRELSDYLLARDGGRTKPAPDDIEHANIGNAAMLSYAESEHSVLDSWAPPAGVSVYQIAGWGVNNTVAGIQFYDEPILGGFFGFKPMYRPIFTEDGDGTVPVPSALLMSDASNVKRYWVDLNKYNGNVSQNEAVKHGNIFSFPEVQELVRKISLNDQSFSFNYIRTSQPATIEPQKKLTFILHSPLTLGLYDENGNYTGLNNDGSADQNIPDATYGEFGEVKYIIAPAGATYRLVLKGQDSGTFSLDIQEQTGDTVMQTTTIAGVPTTAETKASLTVSNENSVSSLTVDENGDDTPDIMIAPETGKTIVYETPAITESVTTTIVSSGGGNNSVASTGEVLGTEAEILPSVSTEHILPALSNRHAISADIAENSTNVSGESDIVISSLASQQSWFQKFTAALYNGWQELFQGLNHFLHWLLAL